MAPVASDTPSDVFLRPVLPHDFFARNAHLKRPFDLATNFGYPVRWWRNVSVDVYTLHALPPLKGDHTQSPFVKVSLGTRLLTKTAVVKDADVRGPVGVNQRVAVDCNTRNTNELLRFEVIYKTGFLHSNKQVGVVALNHWKFPLEQPRPIMLELLEDVPRKKAQKGQKPERTGAMIEVAVTIGPPQPDDFLFRVRQRFWSFGDFSVTDDNNNKVFTVIGRWPSQFTVCDRNRNALLIVNRRSMFAIEHSYDLYGFDSRGNQVKVLAITNRLSFGSLNFSVEDAHNRRTDMSIRGNFFVHSYAINKGGVTLATVCKDYFNMTDAYTLRVSPVAPDVPLIIGMCLVIDKTIDDAERNR
eukprot:CAMPEP_0198336086 /NCGR_PEP_ID=MMETSP1450-20131203/20756_1 /TAXON_ID=753684 ORGANISM="Madagascaria erythrocladiodes, Strain CCMP3234" /NCGR_SAMPLE_ID=MMETSP1450 /ASSEMBLY_ACC=CAM_ASM_001115 /LENGTH=356 /DNA_ID=CAMNT_0044040795 /DNA_START=46 /DNA_END=1116 /DNA_ORIENTATION=+